MNRRGYLRISTAAAASMFVARAATWSVKNAAGRVIAASGSADFVELSRDWHGDICRATVRSRGREQVAIKEVVLFSVAHSLPAETSLYGESFQMLSQTAGT